MKRMLVSLALVILLSGSAYAWTDQYNKMWIAFTLASDQVARSGYARQGAKEFAKNAGQLVNEYAAKGDITAQEKARLQCQILGLSCWLSDGGYSKDLDYTIENVKICIENGLFR